MEETVLRVTDAMISPLGHITINCDEVGRPHVRFYNYPTETIDDEPVVNVSISFHTIDNRALVPIQRITIMGCHHLLHVVGFQNCDVILINNRILNDIHVPGMTHLEVQNCPQFQRVIGSDSLQTLHLISRGLTHTFLAGSFQNVTDLYVSNTHMRLDENRHEYVRINQTFPNVETLRAYMSPIIGLSNLLHLETLRLDECLAQGVLNFPMLRTLTVIERELDNDRPGFTRIVGVPSIESIDLTGVQTLEEVDNVGEAMELRLNGENAHLFSLQRVQRLTLRDVVRLPDLAVCTFLQSLEITHSNRLTELVVPLIPALRALTITQCNALRQFNNVNVNIHLTIRNCRRLHIIKSDENFQSFMVTDCPEMLRDATAPPNERSLWPYNVTWGEMNVPLVIQEGYETGRARYIQLLHAHQSFDQKNSNYLPDEMKREVFKNVFRQ